MLLGRRQLCALAREAGSVKTGQFFSYGLAYRLTAASKYLAFNEIVQPPQKPFVQ